jgi:hypothetical protein
MTCLKPCRLSPEFPARVIGIALIVLLFGGAQVAWAQTNAVPSDSVSPAATNQPASTATNSPSVSLFDREDGMLDVGEFLDTIYGFVPILMPITEPAVGYGGTLGLIFIQRREPNPDGSYQKPNMTVAGGMATENGSWAVMGAHMGNWQDGQFETQVALMTGSINLDFYGIGDSGQANNPLGYNIELTGGNMEGRYRLGQSPWRVGVGYIFGQANVSFDASTLPPGVTVAETDSFLAGLTPKLIYDSRNNLFTPTKGIYAEAGGGVFNEVVGSDFNYETVSLTLLYYYPLAKELTLSLKTEGFFSFDDAPFYTRPYVHLRGAAVRRYVGEHAADAELELRWQCWGRFSLVGFAGAGVAWNDFERFESERTVVTGGLGFRYEIARKHGLHMGLDVAVGPDDVAIYIQFGSAWFRP